MTALLKIDIFGQMPNRSESPLRFFDTNDQKNKMSIKDNIANEAAELAVFLSDTKVDLITVTAVIPSTAVGIMYNVALGKKIEVANGATDIEWFKTNNASLELLYNSIEIMPKKKRKRNKDILNNLKAIKKVVSNPDFWNNPFNPDFSN